MNKEQIGLIFLLTSSSWLIACQSPTDTRTSTEIIAYTPAVPNVVKSGECAASEFVGRADARRCMVGHRIYDPCIAAGDKLVCNASPWQVDQSGNNSEKQPFVIDAGLPGIAAPQADPGGVVAMELADGALCSAVGGDTIDFDGKKVNYRCDTGTATERVVLGHPRKGRNWVADYALLGHNADGLFIHERKYVVVKRIWR